MSWDGPQRIRSVLLVVICSGAINTADHSLLLEIISFFFLLSWHSLFPNVSPTPVSLSPLLVYHASLLHIGSFRAWFAFSIYILPQGALIWPHDFTFHLCTEDFQTYVLSWTFSSTLGSYTQLQTWRSKRSLKHNLAKTFLLFPPHLHISASLSGLPFSVNGITTQPVAQAKVLRCISHSSFS